MKTKLTLLFIWAIFLNNYAQISFEEHIITTETNGATSVYATDIDGDNRIDVLSASQNDGKIAWYQNTDGLGNFGTQQIITNTLLTPLSVYAADIDGDGHIDALSASRGDYIIAWYQNTDGLGNFTTQQIISSTADQAECVFAIDIDGDNDIDVLSASFYDNKIAWYKNIDGLGSFSAPLIISTTATAARYVTATDMDGDSDIDVLAAYNNTVAWYKNLDGLGDFDTPQIIANDAWAVQSVCTSDFDNDGDMDVLAALLGTGTIVWYENTDGLGNFGTQQIISTNADYAISVDANDIDGDGNMDALSASSNDDKIAWYANTNGQGDFSSEQIVTSNADGASSVYTADVDNDGDIDVIVASYYANQISWYENQGNLSVNHNQLSHFSVFPNPTEDILKIDSQTTISQVTIYNQLGQLVLMKKETNLIDISNLKQGIYVVEITDKKGNIENKKVKKN